MPSHLTTLAAALGALLLGSTAAAADEAPRVELRPSRVGLMHASLDPVAAAVPPVGLAESYRAWNWSLFAGGVLLFGASYGGAVLTASEIEHVADGLKVPLLGPWFELTDCDDEAAACGERPTTQQPIVPAGALRHVRPISIGPDGGRGLAYRTRF